MKKTKEKNHELSFHIGEDSQNQDPAPTSSPPFTLRDSLGYFKDNTRGNRGIKISLTGRSGSRIAWLNPYYLLEKESPLESSEMKSALTTLGLSANKVRIKEIHCSALGFQKTYHPSKKLDATLLEEMALLSGMLVVLEEKGQTQLFREKVQEENLQELSEIIQLYETLELETKQDIEPEDDMVMSLEMG